jgi:protein phosphatase
MIGGSILSAGELAGTGAGALTALVCDGVNGCPGGEQAADMAARFFAAMPWASSLFEIVSRTLRLGDAVRTSPPGRAAAALSGLQLSGEQFIAFNLGDVRIYRCGKSGLCRISADHILERSPGTLTRYLGQTGELSPSVSVGALQSGDRFFLLCSDGVYRRADDCALAEIVAGSQPLREKKRAILDLAVRNGSQDDLSVVLIDCGAPTDGQEVTRRPQRTGAAPR